MKTTSNITDYVLVKADTKSEWDYCHFAIIHCTKEWKEHLQQRLKAVQSIENEIGFASLNFYDSSVDFYRTNETNNRHIHPFGRKGLVVRGVRRERARNVSRTRKPVDRLPFIALPLRYGNLYRRRETFRRRVLHGRVFRFGHSQLPPTDR